MNKTKEITDLYDHGEYIFLFTVFPSIAILLFSFIFWQRGWGVLENFVIPISKSISENAKETKFSYITNSLNSQNSSITESINTYTQKDFIFDTNYFTQNLETFSSLAFLSDGNNILKPTKLKMFPYFKKG